MNLRSAHRHLDVLLVLLFLPFLLAPPSYSEERKRQGQEQEQEQEQEQGQSSLGRN
jgi:hypothetical protein